MLARLILTMFDQHMGGSEVGEYWKPDESKLM